MPIRNKSAISLHSCTIQSMYIIQHYTGIFVRSILILSLHLQNFIRKTLLRVLHEFFYFFRPKRLKGNYILKLPVMFSTTLRIVPNNLLRPPQKFLT
jgi:hypothetical protein